MGKRRMITENDVIVDIAYYDGYGVGDTLLDGVLFKIKNDNGVLSVIGYKDADDEEYMKQFNEKRFIAEINKRLNGDIDGLDEVLETEDGENVFIEEDGKTHPFKYAD